ncbi:MAG: hypothetical protein E6K80_14675 [Candidatus Eisenbacteria bacterium]|uniref:Uncharacterized protein n=1 Tax=Eiseniibacteriota bacterium TaxID=2212470 RepID=A0A538TWJ9_UNCEI|nr:MAG: hypothetical protein E6K80_14675 [Candidatus Eisenbacteria bacterium]
MIEMTIWAPSGENVDDRNCRPSRVPSRMSWTWLPSGWATKTPDDPPLRASVRKITHRPSGDQSGWSNPLSPRGETRVRLAPFVASAVKIAGQNPHDANWRSMTMRLPSGEN